MEFWKLRAILCMVLFGWMGPAGKAFRNIFTVVQLEGIWEEGSVIVCVKVSGPNSQLASNLSVYNV